LCFQSQSAIEPKGDGNLSYRLPDGPDHFRSRSLRRRQLIDLQLSPNGSSQLSSRTESAQRERQRRQDVPAQKTPEETSEKTGEETLDGLQQAYETLREETGMSAGKKKNMDGLKRGGTYHYRGNRKVLPRPRSKLHRGFQQRRPRSRIQNPRRISPMFLSRSQVGS
jgi:hypothetical protein